MGLYEFLQRNLIIKSNFDGRESLL